MAQDYNRIFPYIQRSCVIVIKFIEANFPAIKSVSTWRWYTSSLGQWAPMRWWRAQPHTQRCTICISTFIYNLIVVLAHTSASDVCNTMHSNCKCDTLYMQMEASRWRMVTCVGVKRESRGMWNGVLLVELWPKVLESCVNPSPPFPAPSLMTAVSVGTFALALLIGALCFFYGCMNFWAASLPVIVAGNCNRNSWHPHTHICTHCILVVVCAAREALPQWHGGICMAFLCKSHSMILHMFALWVTRCVYAMRSIRCQRHFRS